MTRSAGHDVEQPVAAVEALTFVHGADLSPDGTRVAWCAAWIEGDAERIALRISEIGQRDFVEFSAGLRNHDPVWSPDGSRIAFLCQSEEDGPAQLAVLDVEKGDVAAVSSLPQGVVGRPVWSPDGRRIAFATPPSNGPDPSRPYRVTRAVGWLDGFGLLDAAAFDVSVLDLDTGEHRRLTDDGWVNHLPRWLPGSDELIYLASCDPDSWDPVSRIRAVSLDGAVREIARLPDALAVVPNPAEDGTVVAISSGDSATRALGRLFVIGADGADRADRALEDRSSALGLDLVGELIGDLPVPFTMPEPRLLVDGDEAFVRVHVGDRLEIHRLALSGQPSSAPVVAGEYSAYPLGVASGRLLYAVGTVTTPPDLWVQDLSTGARSKVTFTDEQNAAVLAAPTVEEFWASAPDGPRIQTKFLRPADSSGPVPTVLLIHGGPKAAFGHVFLADAQLLCEAGFGVLLVNPRGSRGYGPDFADAITGRWGQDDYADLMAAVDEAVRRGLADPDRLGVGGLSYGGYMSAWIVAHTHRFRAAMIENPITNFWSMYGTSDVGLTGIAEALGGTPNEVFDRYVRSSPITTADTCRTPTLLVQCEQDHRCPPEQSRQFYSALKRAGCVVEMLLLPGASHDDTAGGPVPVRRAQNRALVEWMVRYVRD